MDRARGSRHDQDGAFGKNAPKVHGRGELLGRETGLLRNRVEIYFPYRTGHPESVSVIHGRAKIIQM